MTAARFCQRAPRGPEGQARRGAASAARQARDLSRPPPPLRQPPPRGGPGHAHPPGAARAQRLASNPQLYRRRGSQPPRRGEPARPMSSPGTDGPTRKLTEAPHRHGNRRVVRGCRRLPSPPKQDSGAGREPVNPLLAQSSRFRRPRRRAGWGRPARLRGAGDGAAGERMAVADERGRELAVREGRAARGGEPGAAGAAAEGAGDGLVGGRAMRTWR